MNPAVPVTRIRIPYSPKIQAVRYSLPGSHSYVMHHGLPPRDRPAGDAPGKAHDLQADNGNMGHDTTNGKNGWQPIQADFGPVWPRPMPV
ncbi:hypothetical protein Gain_0064_052 [Komagataeibacter intermedius TF2]|nr:hypothetical protein Gain_0064_052 [Komagataeibacter intermedius TF2]